MAVSCTIPNEISQKEIVTPSKEKTLKAPVSLTGIGLFTGEKTTLTICPAPPGTGLIIQRVDLPGMPELIADLHHVVNTPRCTILGNEKMTIYTVEHVLAALCGMEIDNAILKLDGSEFPIMDGSAFPFVEAIIKGGVKEQSKEKFCLTLDYPVAWSNGDVHLVGLPSNEFRISYTLHFPQSKTVGSQYFSTPINRQMFIEKIAKGRTFCFFEEIAPLVERGQIKGGGPENAVIIKNDLIINSDLRFSDEMVRHKVLDLLGDLSLIPGFNTFAKLHVIALCSGHKSNVAFAQELLNYLKMEKA